jgi:hypothetical protein
MNDSERHDRDVPVPCVRSGLDLDTECRGSTNDRDANSDRRHASSPPISIRRHQAFRFPSGLGRSRPRGASEGAANFRSRISHACISSSARTRATNRCTSSPLSMNCIYRARIGAPAHREFRARVGVPAHHETARVGAPAPRETARVGAPAPQGNSCIAASRAFWGGLGGHGALLARRRFETHVGVSPQPTHIHIHPDILPKPRGGLARRGKILQPRGRNPRDMNGGLQRSDRTKSRLRENVARCCAFSRSASICDGTSRHTRSTRSKVLLAANEHFVLSAACSRASVRAANARSFAR